MGALEVLPNVAKGEEHIVAHNKEREHINAIMLQMGELRRSRETATIITEPLPSGEYETGRLSMALGYRLYRLETNCPTRVRLYATILQRNADIDRPDGTLAIGNHGLILEYVTAEDHLAGVLTPMVDGANLEVEPSDDIPYTITNLSKAESPVTVTFTYIRTE